MNQQTIKPRNGLFRHERFVDYLPWILMLVVILFMSLELWHEGRIWWCELDYPIYLWTPDAWSPHTSQHLFDPYSFTHLLHGVLFLWAANLLFRGRIRFAWILLFAVFGESIWEVIENSPWIIEKYRANTASLNYFGDSIANSIGDVISCIIGFITAYKLRFWKSLILFAVIEITLMITIRDSLIINIIMLIYPVEAIKTWQVGV
jgi:hypothetical protein